MNEYMGNAYGYARKNDEVVSLNGACMVNLCFGDTSSSCTGNFCGSNAHSGCFLFACGTREAD